MNKKNNEAKIKLSLKELTKKYSNGDGVEGINLNIYESELLTMLGPSGCGKTTILRAIGGFIEADSGEIILDEVNIENLPPEKRPTVMVFQSYNLWPHMTIFENLAFGLKLRKIDKKQIQSEIKEVLTLIRMEGVEKKYPSQLSGGQQQRIAIARALLLKPSVLLLDEPFSALDAKIRAQMREELKKIQSELSITIVFVTHDQEEAMTLSDRIVVMNKGVFEQIGTPEEIYDNPKSKFVAEFIGNMNFIEEEDKIIAARPENTIINKNEIGDYFGDIVNSVILGHFVEISVATDKGIIKAFLSREEAKAFSQGDRVGISFRSNHSFNK
ncbi:ABC transporter ATP-binding protein [Clostridium pasteurianum]|uniref:ABC-type quaternary amine transporter n=1 Tax=Clostridium pasteurianum BC1 TaxID=86416 RepID=R4KI80_CLOPA|nr:ABC transporter ATP-binding protein [Clostridium pasteurianum]AGK99325.1 ABC-type spermidine/putrescine transport system, ATPase component [Clostridium pasteurianum BC1]